MLVKTGSTWQCSNPCPIVSRTRVIFCMPWKVAEPDAGATEFVDVEEKSIEEFEEMIKSGEFRCGICQLVWYRVKEATSAKMER